MTAFRDFSHIQVGFAARAFAPASLANLAVGFDTLGMSFPAVGDEVEVTVIAPPKVEISEITVRPGTRFTEGLETLPRDAKTNTATAGLVQLCQDLQLPFGFSVKIQKGISMGSGMGGSAASAVAAVLAANAVLGSPLTQRELIPYMLWGEAKASGGFHADNIAPCLVGGLVISWVQIGEERKHVSGLTIPQVMMRSLPLPSGVYALLIHPHLQVETKTARGILAPTVSLAKHVRQSAYFAGFVSACYENDLELIQETLQDLLIEPQRQHLIPGFAEAQSLALAHEALGFSISGAGPSMFAWFRSLAAAQKAEKVLTAHFQNGERALTPVESWIHPLTSEGARILWVNDSP